MTVTETPNYVAMDLDEEEDLFFGQLGPVKRDSRPTDSGALPATLANAKRQRVDQQDKGKGKGGKGKGKAKGKEGPRQQEHPKQGWPYHDGSEASQGNPWTSERGLPPLHEDSRWGSDRTLNYNTRERLEWMENRVQRLTQLTLRQEQLLVNIRQDMMMYLFVRSGDTGMIPVLCQSADRWRQLKEDTPEKLSMSLKLAMFKQLLISLQERLTATAKDAKAMEHAQSLGWLDKDQQWKVLRWNSTKQHLEVEETVKPTSTSDLISQIVQVRKGVTEDSLLRFKSIRRLSPDVKADWIQFQLVISLRAEASHFGRPCRRGSAKPRGTRWGVV